MSSTAVTQARIHAIAQANPGIHTAQVAMILGLAWNTTMHHVRSMEREGRITVQKIDGKIRLFDRKQGAFSGKQAAATLQDPENRTIAAYVLKNPGRTQRQLAAALGLSTTAVHRRLCRMEEAGLLQRLASGRCTLVQPLDALPDVFVRTGITSFDAVTESADEAPVPTVETASQPWSLDGAAVRPRLFVRRNQEQDVETVSA